MVGLTKAHPNYSIADLLVSICQHLASYIVMHDHRHWNRGCYSIPTFCAHLGNCFIKWHVAIEPTQRRKGQAFLSTWTSGCILVLHKKNLVAQYPRHLHNALRKNQKLRKRLKSYLYIAIKRQGRPLLLQEGTDRAVQEYIKSLRSNGGYSKHTTLAYIHL